MIIVKREIKKVEQNAEHTIKVFAKAGQSKISYVQVSAAVRAARNTEQSTNHQH